MKKCKECNINNVKSISSTYCWDCSAKREKLSHLKHRIKRLEQLKNKDYIILSKYKDIVKDANKRNIEIDITIDDLASHYHSNCFYCNDFINTISIDRLHRDNGFIKTNIISVCHICKQMMILPFCKEKNTGKRFINHCCKVMINTNKK